MEHRHNHDDHHHDNQDHHNDIAGIQTERSAQHQLSQQQEHWRAAMEHNKQVFDINIVTIS